MAGLVANTSTTALAPAHLVDQARSYAASSKAEATRRAYRRDFTAFVSWCDENGLQPLPATPQTVALYLTARAEGGVAVSKGNPVHPAELFHPLLELDRKNTTQVVATHPLQPQ